MSIDNKIHWCTESEFPPLDSVITVDDLPRPDLSTQPVVTFAALPEDDPTISRGVVEIPITRCYERRTIFGRWRLVTRTRIEQRVCIPQRRRRYETWRDQDGRDMGSWRWVPTEPRYEPLPAGEAA